MERLELSVTKRTSTGKEYAQKLRQKGWIPAVAYGKGKEPVSFELCSRDLALLLNRSQAKDLQLTLVDGADRHDVLVRRHDVHPVTRALVHADFQFLDEERPIKVKIPLRTLGKSKGEAAGARLTQVQREVTVSCLPRFQTDVLEMDVSHLQASEVMYVDQITFPEGITPVYRKKYPVVVVSKVAVAEAPTEGAAAPAPAGK
jgi:large subunit ribosomal protein L25